MDINNERAIVELSIVVPVYNESENIQMIYSKLIPVLENLTADFEIVFVDDGSRDGTLDIIKSINIRDQRVLGISLSRNFGHQIAIIAGLEFVKGQLVVTMDADMQHPPSIVKNLYSKIKEGYDIVNTLRKDDKGNGIVKRETSKWFYKIINKLSDVPIHKGSADFRIMNRKALDAFLEMKEKDRFNRGLVSWMGFNQTYIHYDAPKRYKGSTKYSFWKMVGLAKDGIFSFSSKPLRISFYLGLVVSVLGLFYTIYSITQYFLGNTQPGWTSIMAVVLIIGGVQLVSIGIIGEYLARVFNEVKNRPLYYINEYIKSDTKN
jgi:polyisoprenyl-phosphate glycosyltransferase